MRDEKTGEPQGKVVWGGGDGVNHQRKIVATHHGDVMNCSLSEKDLKTDEQIRSRLSFEKE